jgi:hypothetical protein
MIGPHEEGELLPAALETAAGVLREAADALPLDRLEWVCGHQLAPELVEYRLVVEAEAVQSRLRELAGFFEEACGRGFGVQLWL